MFLANDTALTICDRCNDTYKWLERRRRRRRIQAETETPSNSSLLYASQLKEACDA